MRRSALELGRALRLPEVVALRRAARARILSQRRRHAQRTGSRCARTGRVQARRRRAVAGRDPTSRRDADRDGRGPGPTEPVEHLTRPARAPLVQGGRSSMRQPVAPRDTLGTGLLLLLVVPLTLVVILPTNKRLESQELDLRSQEGGRLLRRWGRLHAIRSILSGAAF